MKAKCMDLLPPVKVNWNNKKAASLMTQKKKDQDTVSSAELLSRAVQTVGNHYLLCNLLSQRIKQLSDGAPKRVPAQGLTVTETAVKEIVGGQLKWETGLETPGT